MTKRKERHWYSRRTNKDAPSYVYDQAHTPESLWAQGYNDAVQAYMDELREAMRAEGFDVDGSEWSRG